MYRPGWKETLFSLDFGLAIETSLASFDVPLAGHSCITGNSTSVDSCKRQPTEQGLPAVSQAANTVPVPVGFEEELQEEAPDLELGAVQLAGLARGWYDAA